MIQSFNSNTLQELWVDGNTGLLPVAYVYEVINILDDLDDAAQIQDLVSLGGFQIEEAGDCWAVTITVNNLEPIGAVTCLFRNGDAYQVSLNIYD